MENKYVYFVKNLTTGLKYIGVKYGRNSNPNSFWVEYFTSSKTIKLLIDIYGKDDFEYKILKTFDNEYEAMNFERKLLVYAVKKDDYLNLHVNFMESTEEDYLRNKEKHRNVASIVGKLTYVKKLGFFGCSEERKKEIRSLGGFAASKINKKNGKAIYSEDVRKRQHETLRKLKVSAYYDPKLRKMISSKGGKVGCFSKAYYENNGLLEEDRIKAQSERGKKGGKKNKGFKWYNDGNRAYKYNLKQQGELSFDDFLIQNNFNKGRIKK